MHLVLAQWLVENPELSPADFTLALVRAFEQDVTARIGKLS